MTGSHRRRNLVLVVIGTVGLAFAVTVFSVQFENLPLRNGYVMQNGELLGGDFIAFYTAGRLYDRHPEALYDLRFQRDFRTELLGPARTALKGELPFVYPPLVAAVLSALAPLRFWLAFVLSAVVAGASGTLVIHGVNSALGRGSPLLQVATLIALWGFIPFSLNTVLGGQLSWLGMVCLGGVVWSLQTRRPMLAGLAMSLSYYKPPLFLLALAVLVLTEGRRFLAGFAIGALVLMSLTVLAVGLTGLSEFLGVVSRYTYGQDVLEGVELPPGAGAGVYGLLTSLVGTDGLWAPGLLGILFLATGGILVHVRRRQSADDLDGRALWLAAVGIASVGLSLQCIRYDLALLAIPMLILARLERHFTGMPRFLLFGSLVGFYLEFLLRKTPVAGYTLNFSSVLFLVILPTCLLTLLRQSRSLSREQG